jgi:hypothetical protein
MTASGEISRERAVAIAREAIQGHVELTSPADVQIERKGKTFVVTFPRSNPPDVLAADYDARVTIDVRTGDVLKILGAS